MSRDNTKLMVSGAIALGLVALLRRQPSIAQVGAPLEPLRSEGESYVRPGWYSSGEASGSAITPNMLLFMPIYHVTPRRYSGIGAYVYIGASPGSVARLGIYSSIQTPTGIAPGSLILDAGAIPIDSSGIAVVGDDIPGEPGYTFIAMVQSDFARYWSPDEGRNISVPVTGRSGRGDPLEKSTVILLTGSTDPTWVNALPAQAPDTPFGSTASLAIPFLRY